MTPASRDIKTHDFHRTDLLERSELQMVSSLLEDYPRTISNRFSAVIHQSSLFEMVAIDQLTWRDLVEAFEVGTYYFSFSMPPYAGRLVVALPTDEVLALVDLRLAGSGDDDFSGRAPSEIDQAFVAPLIGELVSELAKAVVRYQTVIPELESQVGRAELVSFVSPNDMFIVVSLDFEIANRSRRRGLLCLPFSMVRLIIDTIQSRTAPSAGSADDSSVALRRLREVPLQLVFQFPSFVTTPAQLLTLRVGDSLGLDHPKGRPLEVRVEGLLVALADMCSSGVHKACEIREEVTK